MAKSLRPSALRPLPQASHPGAERLLQAIAAEFGSLSRQLKLIARHVEQHRDHIGLDRIQDVATRCGVQPSAVIRFAKRFGFSGYSEMQKIFREGIAQQISPSRSYQARIRSVIDAAQGQLSSADIADEFIGGSMAITDSKMSPFAALAAATLVVHESSTFGFRSLSNTMCLAQSLFIALAYRTELLYPPAGPSSAALR